MREGWSEPRFTKQCVTPAYRNGSVECKPTFEECRGHTSHNASKNANWLEELVNDIKSVKS
jgi:hypothetical protein